MDIQALLRCYYDRATLTTFVKEDSELREEVITLAHKPIDARTWAALKAIEADGNGDVAVRQIVALDVTSNDITEGGKPAQLNAETLTKLGPVFQQELINAIIPNIKTPVAFAGVTPLERKPKRSAKSKSSKQPPAETQQSA